jgi:heme exporter protein D
VSLMGIMYTTQSSTNLAIYANSRDAITSFLIFVIIISLIYLLVVTLTEARTAFLKEIERRRRFREIKARRHSATARPSSMSYSSPMADQERISTVIAARKAVSSLTSTDMHGVGHTQDMSNPLFGSLNQPDAASTTQRLMVAAAGLSSMVTPPDSAVLWHLYRDTYASLVENLAECQRRVRQLPEELRGSIPLLHRLSAMPRIAPPSESKLGSRASTRSIRLQPISSSTGSEVTQVTHQIMSSRPLSAQYQPSSSQSLERVDDKKE